MSRARYSPINIGHKGLAKKNYCHFTSPIRRYADLTDHRILRDTMLKKNQRDIIKYWGMRLPIIGAQTSKTEKMADDAESQTLLLKCAEYMKEHIGEEFKGTVIGVSEHGLSIQLDNYIEGKVRTKDMIGDYTYNPDTYTLISLDGEENYYIGDRLNLIVKYASKKEKIIEFAILEKIDENYIANSSKPNQYVKMMALEKRTCNRVYGV